MVVLPIVFNTSFALLGLSFGYPDILRRPTSEVLTRFRQGGSSLVFLWWSFALSALLFAPLVSPALAFHRRRRRDPARGGDDDRSAGVRRAIPRARALAVPRPVPRSHRSRARCERGPARGGRRRLPVLQPLPRRRRRRAPRLPADGRLERARGRGPAPDGRGAVVAGRGRHRGRRRPDALLARVRRAASSPPAGSSQAMWCRSPTSPGRSG